MNLIRILKEQNMEALGKRIGVDRTTVLRWLNGEHSPTFIDVISIIHATGDSPEEVLNFFTDLISAKPSRAPKDALDFINRYRIEQEWKKTFKGA